MAKPTKNTLLLLSDKLSLVDVFGVSISFQRRFTKGKKRRATAISQRLWPGGCAAGNLHLYTKIDQLPCHVGSSLEGLEP